MQDNTADNLNREMLQPDNAPARLAAGGKRLGKNIVKGFPVCESLFEFGCFRLKLFIRQSGILLLKREHFIRYRADSFNFL